MAPLGTNLPRASPVVPPSGVACMEQTSVDIEVAAPSHEVSLIIKSCHQEGEFDGQSWHPHYHRESVFRCSPLMWSCYNPSIHILPCMRPRPHNHVPSSTRRVPLWRAWPECLALADGCLGGQPTQIHKIITDGAFRRALLYGGVCSAETRPPPCRGKSGDTAPQELFLNHPGSQLTDRSRLIQAPHSTYPLP